MRYRTIVADPPWHYEGFAKAPGGERKRGLKPQTVALPYEALSVEAIKALPVGAMAAEDCRLFLWTTNRYLPATFEVAEAWGFTYVQALVWHKTGNPSPFGGSVAPIHAEFLIVAKRGSVEILDRWPSSVIAANKPRDEHSRKPDVFLDLVEHVSPAPYLELFARRARFGWDYWGDESLGTAELDVERGGPGTDVDTLERGSSVLAGGPLGAPEDPGVAARLAERPEKAA